LSEYKRSENRAEEREVEQRWQQRCRFLRAFNFTRQQLNNYPIDLTQRKEESFWMRYNEIPRKEAKHPKVEPSKNLIEY